MSPEELEDRDYTLKETAALFGVHTETVRLWLLGHQALKMNGTKDNRGRWLVSKDEIITHANRLYGGE